MARAAGCIAHLHRQQRLYLLLRRRKLCYALLDDWFEGSADEILHKVRTGVVRGGALTVETANKTKQPVGWSYRWLNERSHLQYALINRPELLYIQ